MCSHGAVALVICCAIFVVVTGYPLDGQKKVQAEHLQEGRDTRSPNPNSRNYRPGFGFGSQGFGGPGYGNQGFGGGYWRPQGGGSSSNANSFNSAVQTPFGSFSNSFSFGGSSSWGKK